MATTSSSSTVRLPRRSFSRTPTGRPTSSSFPPSWTSSRSPPSRRRAPSRTNADETREKTLRIAGILPTFYDLRTHVSEELLETLRGRFTRILSPIRINVALAEAPAKGQTIFEFDGSSRGAVDYALLAEDLKLA